jgi:hypothetical protein
MIRRLTEEATHSLPERKAKYWARVEGKRRAEWVAVRRGGECLAVRIVEGRGDYRMTAASTVVFGEALIELRAAEPSRTGVFAPEELFALHELLPELERRGIRILAR